MKTLVSLSTLPALALRCSLQPESVHDSFLNTPRPRKLLQMTSLEEVGAGGLELIGFYDYGGAQADPATSRTDWTYFGWGTQAWINTTRTAFRAAKNQWLLMNLALGPSQGCGVPAEPETEGLQYDLVPFNVSISLGSSFKGKIPGLGSGKLIAASTALIVEQQPVNISTNPGFLGTVYTNGTKHILATRSLTDVSSKVAEDGSLNIELPHNETGIECRLFASYKKFSRYREQLPPNGSRVNDHFSVAGARLLIDVWENVMLDDELRQLLHDVGNLAWEDSMEFGAGVAAWWTLYMLKAFQPLVGYDLAKYLPLLFSHVSQDPGPLPSPNRFFTDDKDGGQSYLHDYWTLTALNRVYLEMLQFFGPAKLAGRNIISNEKGAECGAAYTQTLPELIFDVKRSIMGGVNKIIYHGYPYSGFYPNTTWPGYTTFYCRFSSIRGPRQPAWEYYNDYMGWTSRMQLIAQTDVPKTYVAFWIHDLARYTTLPKYNASEMNNIGDFSDNDCCNP
ncbi:hypothetical protein CKM354_001034100 [Cercospora kikuchii]|uniref:Uncharacterized protein n=1 Tax=Cercospora kikuchii TaxID=84275 RepID=A0A9P3CMI2_9PEZI|nr:uncharacterized protein CKM354_001034100 [Cercospora kikuchii]GIZ47244.1 hypothetical protein CKM354_001034100 [Cercospora kikuchii]